MLSERYEFLMMLWQNQILTLCSRTLVVILSKEYSGAGEQEVGIDASLINRFSINFP